MFKGMLLLLKYGVAQLSSQNSAPNPNTSLLLDSLNTVTSYHSQRLFKSSNSNEDLNLSNKFMRIAFVNPPWTIAAPEQAYNSMGIWSYEVGRRLANSCKVIFYGKPGDTSTNCKQDLDLIEYRAISTNLDDRLRFLGLLHQLRFPGHQFPFSVSLLRYIHYCFRLAIDIRSQNCDIIHIHNFYQFAPLIRLLNPKATIVLHMHNEWLNWFDHAVAKRRLKAVDYIIGCSEHVTRKASDAFPEWSDRMVAIFNGVDVRTFSNPSINSDVSAQLSKRLLFVSRVSPEKGVHVLIDAFNCVAEEDLNVHLTIVGPEFVANERVSIAVSDDPKVLKLKTLYSQLRSCYNGSYLAYLKDKISPKVADRVKFVGVVERSDLPHYYHNADILVSPSLSETFGMSLVEGMASGIPVIGARVGGMISVVQEGVTGLLVESGNAASLANAIQYLLSNPKLCQKMGEAGREQAIVRFSWEQVAANLFDFYRELMECRKSDNES